MDVGDKCNFCGLTCDKKVQTDKDGNVLGFDVSLGAEQGCDPCLGYLPGVTSACCGHGEAGFITFEPDKDGIKKTIVFWLQSVEGHRYATHFDGTPDYLHRENFAPVIIRPPEADYHASWGSSNNNLNDNSVQISNSHYVVHINEDGTFNVLCSLRPVKDDNDEWQTLTLAENLTGEELLNRYGIRGEFVNTVMEFAKTADKWPFSEGMGRLASLNEGQLIAHFRGEIQKEEAERLSRLTGVKITPADLTPEQEVEAMEQRLATIVAAVDRAVDEDSQTYISPVPLHNLTVRILDFKDRYDSEAVAKLGLSKRMTAIARGTNAANLKLSQHITKITENLLKRNTA